jgi:hypothetical protein
MSRNRLGLSFLIVSSAAVLVVRVSAVNPPEPVALLETHTLFTVYGRGFDIAPILGRLGTYKDFSSLESNTHDQIEEITSVNRGKAVATGIELIYGMAVPCRGTRNCLDYLDEKANIVERYIRPAEERGWEVILETQLGRSDPIAQVRHMIDRGYLDYDNVHVAIDPEFHVYPGRELPGTPVGTVEATEINEVQATLDDLVRREHLGMKKILIVHQFGDVAFHDGVPNMIRDKTTLKTFPNVELVIDADGLGTPLVKIAKYNRITSNEAYSFIQFRGIKIFYRSPLEQNGHYDKPPMTLRQVFGLDCVSGGIRMRSQPNVIIIA